MMAAPGHFADKLLEAIETKRSHVVVGLDPDYALFPPEMRADSIRGTAVDQSAAVVECCRRFLREVVEAVAHAAVAVKLQVAFFEALGPEGYALYEELVRVAQGHGLLVIADVKRGDIGSTAEAYARAHLDRIGADAVTVNPYFGSDGLEPFLVRARQEGKGVFVLVKTSNPSSSELQDVELAQGGLLYERVGDLVGRWGEPCRGVSGYSSVGAVVGATHPQEAARLRRRLRGVVLLVPGYGAQGARAEDLVGVFDDQGTGTVVNSARAILYAYRAHPGISWKDAAVQELREMRAGLWRAAGRG